MFQCSVYGDSLEILVQLLPKIIDEISVFQTCFLDCLEAGTMIKQWGMKSESIDTILTVFSKIGELAIKEERHGFNLLWTVEVLFHLLASVWFVLKFPCFFMLLLGCYASLFPFKPPNKSAPNIKWKGQAEKSSICKCFWQILQLNLD